ncbi:MAG: hypothetical protein GF355_17790 [Candidatus Eisenbacteria bacterium]|nr:hypothetical protein [Candidatus Eisenbacteria bacterium]
MTKPTRSGLPPWIFLTVAIVALGFAVYFVQAGIRLGFTSDRILRLIIWAAVALFAYLSFDRKRRLPPPSDDDTPE